MRTSILDERFLHEEEAEDEDLDFVPSSSSADEGSDDDNARAPAYKQAYSRAAQLFSQLKAESLKTLVHKPCYPAASPSLATDNESLQTDFDIHQQIRLHITRYDPTAPREPLPRSDSFALSLADTQQALSALIASEKVIQERRVRFAGKEFVVLEDNSGKKQRLKEVARSGQLERLAGQLDDAKQVSSVDKSRADWLQEVRGKGDAEELEQHKKTGGFIARKMFLENAGSTEAPGRRGTGNR